MKHTLIILLTLNILLITNHANAQGFKIGAGSCVVSGNNTIVVINEGAISNNGSFDAASGTVLLKGTTAQNIAGTSTTVFNNLINTNINTITANAPIHIKSILLLSAGELNANGKLTLLSSSTQTALIDGSGAGSVTGNVTMQRYLANGFGYKYISAPFVAATVKTLNNHVPLTDTFPAMYTFNENLLTAGWEVYTDTNNVLTPVKGFAANFGSSANAKVFDIYGVVNNGTVTLSPLYNNNRTYTQGYQLIGNPYPSPINWDAASGCTKTNIDNAIYYFNNGVSNRYTGTYSSYINGVSSDGIASNIIPAMQGFFVHVSNGSFPVTGSLQITNAARTTHTNVVYHRQNRETANIEMIRLTASLGNEKTNDPVVVYIDAAANEQVNYQLDALKLMNTNVVVPSLYAIASTDKKLSIKALPKIDSNIFIPLGIKVEQQGFVNFKLTDATISTALYVYFIDKQSQSVTDIRNAAYGATLNAGINNTRFALFISKKRVTDYYQIFATDNNATVADVYSHQKNITVNTILNNGEKATMVLYDVAGKVVLTKEIRQSGRTSFYAPITVGVYIATIYSNNKTVVSKKLFITD